MCLTRDGLGKKSELVPGDSLPFDPCHSTALRQVLLLPFYRRGSGGPGRSSDCWHHAVPTLQSPARFYRLMHCQRGGPSRWGAWVDLGVGGPGLRPQPSQHLIFCTCPQRGSIRHMLKLCSYVCCFVWILIALGQKGFCVTCV